MKSYGVIKLFLALIFCLSIICDAKISKVKHQNSQHQHVHMKVFGDTGQIDQFWVQSMELKIINALYNFNLKSKVDKPDEKTKFDRKLKLDTMQIIEKIKGEDLDESTPPEKVFKNFSRLFKCGKDLWDRSVILGDAVYTENKGYLGFKSQFDLKDLENKVYSNLVKIHKNGVTAQMDLENKKKFTLHNISGDIDTLQEEKAKQLASANRHFGFTQDKMKMIDITEALRKRVDWAIKRYKSLLDNLKKDPTCNAKLHPFVKDTGDHRTGRFRVIPGNHNFDIDAKLEEKVEHKVAAIPPFDHPTIEHIWIEQNKSSVIFLDVNLMYMTCINYESYEKCINDNVHVAYSKLPTPEQAKIYAVRLVEQLINMKYAFDNVSWRVIRSHNSILNPEIDLHHLLNYKVHATCHYFLENDGGKEVNEKVSEAFQSKTKKRMICNIPAKGHDKTDFVYLNDAFKESLTDFWMASHYHAAMLIAAPWEREWAKRKIVVNQGQPTMKLEDDNYQAEFLNLFEPQKCIERSKVFLKMIRNPLKPQPKAPKKQRKQPKKEKKPEKNESQLKFEKSKKDLEMKARKNKAIEKKKDKKKKTTEEIQEEGVTQAALTKQNNEAEMKKKKEEETKAKKNDTKKKKKSGIKDMMDKAKANEKRNNILKSYVLNLKHPGPPELTQCNVEKKDERTLIHLLKDQPQELFLNFIVGHSGRYFDPLKSDERSNGDIIWARSYSSMYVDQVLKCYTDKGCACKTPGKDCTLNHTDLFPNGELNEEYYKTKKKEIMDRILDIDSGYGYAHVNFEKNYVIIEYREVDSNNVIKVVKRFELDRKPTPHFHHRLTLLTDKKSPDFNVSLFETNAVSIVKIIKEKQDPKEKAHKPIEMKNPEKPDDKKKGLLEATLKAQNIKLPKDKEKEKEKIK